MLAGQMNAVMAHQRRIEEIDKAIKQAEKFLDHKAYLVDENGKRVLLTTAEMFKLREAEELAIHRVSER